MSAVEFQSVCEFYLFAPELPAVFSYGRVHEVIAHEEQREFYTRYHRTIEPQRYSYEEDARPASAFRGKFN